MKAADWRRDLEASRDLTPHEKVHFEFFLVWFEQWRLRGYRAADRNHAIVFWRSEVLAKKQRKKWHSSSKMCASLKKSICG